MVCEFNYGSISSVCTPKNSGSNYRSKIEIELMLQVGFNYILIGFRIKLKIIHRFMIYFSKK